MARRDKRRAAALRQRKDRALRRAEAAEGTVTWRFVRDYTRAFALFTPRQARALRTLASARRRRGRAARRLRELAYAALGSIR